MLSGARNVSSSVYQTLSTFGMLTRAHFWFWRVTKHYILGYLTITQLCVALDYTAAQFRMTFGFKSPSKYLQSMCRGTLCSSPEGECSVEMLHKPHKSYKLFLWTSVCVADIHVLLTHVCCSHTWIVTTLCFQVYALLYHSVHTYVVQAVRRWCPALSLISLLALAMSALPSEMAPWRQCAWVQRMTEDTVSGTSKCPEPHL